MKKTQIETLTDQLFSMEANQPLLINELEPYVELFMHYECAMLEIETKLNVFDKEFSLHGESNPIESVSTRLKTPLSLMNKLKRLDLPFDIETIKNNIYDVAGVRVICSFKDDVYKLVEALKQQDDLTIIAEKDYIKNYKNNGYRSYHLIVKVPIFLSDKVEHVAVEIQLLLLCAEISAKLDNQMQKVKEIIEDDSQLV